jgi:hypothetical protein
VNSERVQTNPEEQPPLTPYLGGARDRPWQFRFWNGMGLGAWLRLLVRTHAAVAWPRVPMAMMITFTACINTMLAVVQTLFLGRAIARTRLTAPPLFIIGHWRSGTTLLHELLALDERHTCPDTYACFAPAHFLLSQRWLAHWVRRLLPRRRLFDNMAVAWERPQEDEFALCNLGARSPYLTMAFPNRPPRDEDYRDLATVTPAARRRWQRRLYWFYQCLTLRMPKRLVVKSPLHTCRIPLLLAMFPGAQFIYLARDPRAVIPSTIHTWRRLYHAQGLQIPDCVGLHDRVIEIFNRHHATFERDRALIPPGQLCELRYEDLIADPPAQLARIYAALGLGGVDALRPTLARYCADHANYTPNRHCLSSEQEAQITNACRAFITRHGYAPAPE